jgi:hypothetical protein
VPLGDAYVELVAVVDEQEAAGNPFGRRIASFAGPSPRPCGWVVRPPDLDITARHLGLRIGEGSRVLPDGKVVRWRMAGTDDAFREPLLPFFIEWEDPASHPGRIPRERSGGPVEIGALQLRGDRDRLREWLGPHQLPITVIPGAPAVTKLVLTRPEGEIVIRA